VRNLGKRRKTGLTGSEWKAMFAEAAKYCAKNKAPGERIQDCIRRYLGHKVAVRA
jgi:hypothetical protein